MDPSISHKVVRGSFWIFGLRITNRGLGLLRTIILARLLSPEHFGVLAIAVLAVSLLETFSQPGYGVALVQKRGDIDEHLDTAWTISVIRGIVIYAVLCFFASYIADFFDTPQSKLVIQVFALSIIIAGCRNIGVIHFQKDMDFRKQYIYELSTTLANIAVALPAVFILKNVWALVLGGIAGSIARLVMSYVLHPYRPRIRFDKEKTLELLGFGKWVLGSTILGFLVTQGDDIFLGKKFGAAALGLYQMAYMISNLPSTEITHVISRVTFPAYAVMQDDRKRLADAYMKVLQTITFIAIPFAGGIFILSSEFVSCVLAQKWMGTVPIINVLVWSGLITAIMGSAEPVFNAVGQPRLHTKWQFRRFVVLGVFIYPLTLLWGMIGVPAAVLLANTVAAVGCTYDAGRITKGGFSGFVKMLSLPLLGMAVGMGAVWCLKRATFYNSIVELIVLVLSGIVVYFVVTWILDRLFNYNMANILKESIMSLKAASR
ncbi:MAG: lipopolysaccharide biosynthesis protein [Thermodesulfobacteriota bacterium]|nr:lipopolysaccharide biosynthesis protein [Thermodesulfobacteriota bacterium]